ncbi:ESX secretion-associated protein EspG [Mycobacterium camsae]|uniref:ESX secretion-associated protein EspG n=1 Tax=Mycobacterium gordonae TaxID=1778 RepID=UPI001980CBAC|nr:ESX secretion-associated protein EspG [Mycobacterium gordonae]
MVTPTATDITVNLDGLWLLQALVGVNRLAAELRGRPCGQPRSMKWIAQHPGLAVLVAEGICDEAAVVRSDIATRMRVLGTPDVEVVVLVSHGPMTWSSEVLMDDPSSWRAIPDGQLRIVLARREGRWASAVRAGSHVTIDDCAAAVDADWLVRLVCDALDSVHYVEPARISAVNVPMDGICTAAAELSGISTAGLSQQAALKSVGFSGTTLAQLTEALQEPVAEAVLYARAYVEGAAVAGESVLNLRDTKSGRVALYRVNPPRGSHQQWMAVGPAHQGQIRHGVLAALDSVAVNSWDTHERMC